MAETLRFYEPTTRTAPPPRFSRHGESPSDGAGGSGRGVHGFAATSHGACDDVVNAIGLFVAHGAGHGGDRGNGNGAGRDSSSTPADGHATGDEAGYPYPHSSSAPHPPRNLTSAQHHRSMESPVSRDHTQRQCGQSNYTMHEQSWNDHLEKLAAFSEWSVPLSAVSNSPAAQKERTTTITALSSEMQGRNTSPPHHAPLRESIRFVNEPEADGGRSTLHLSPLLRAPPQPLTAPTGDGRVPPSGRLCKKLRTPLATISGAAVRSPPSKDGRTAATGSSSTSVDPLFKCRTSQRFVMAAEGETTGGPLCEGPSTAACASFAGAGGLAESQLQLLKIFPASVSLEEQTSLYLAFGSALTPEAWLSATSTLLDAELDLD